MTCDGILLLLSFKTVVVRPRIHCTNEVQEDSSIFPEYVLYVDLLKIQFFQVAFGLLTETLK